MLPAVAHAHVKSVAELDLHSSPYVDSDALFDTQNEAFPDSERKFSMNQLGMLNELVVQLTELAWMFSWTAAMGVAVISRQTRPTLPVM